MKCYHILGRPPPYAWTGVPHQWLRLPLGKYLVVHEGYDGCPEPATAKGHLLDTSATMGADAAALAAYGVAASDRVAAAMLKVGAKWRAAIP